MITGSRNLSTPCARGNPGARGLAAGFVAASAIGISLTRRIIGTLTPLWDPSQDLELHPVTCCLASWTPLGRWDQPPLNLEYLIGLRRGKGRRSSSQSGIRYHTVHSRKEPPLVPSPCTFSGPLVRPCLRTPLLQVQLQISWTILGVRLRPLPIAVGRAQGFVPGLSLHPIAQASMVAGASVLVM